MRANTTQKAYDEAFLACSTAVYFEGQVSANTEAEAKRCKDHIDAVYGRTMRKKLCGRGRLHLITSTTTMPVATPPRTVQPRPQRKPFSNLYDNSNYNAKRGWTYWKR
jgi:hypothetical protein